MLCIFNLVLSVVSQHVSDLHNGKCFVLVMLPIFATFLLILLALVDGCGFIIDATTIMILVLSWAITAVNIFALSESGTAVTRAILRESNLRIL